MAASPINMAPLAGWDELARKLSGIEGIVSVFALSGDVDLMLEIVHRTGSIIHRWS